MILSPAQAVALLCGTAVLPVPRTALAATATTYQVDGDQFAALMVGLALVVMLLGVVAVSLWRRS